MKIAITGGSGFIGKNLIRELISRGYSINLLDLEPPGREKPRGGSRGNATLPPKVAFFRTDLVFGKIPGEALEGTEGIIHLAGKNIFARWNSKTKTSIYESRVLSARNLVLAIKDLTRKPKALISASATGYYGDRGEEELFESSEPGNSFLARVCADWEAETKKAETLGVRTVQVRTAPVLGRAGGFLQKMLPTFKLSLGGPIGNGKQWFPWIHMDDIVGIYAFSLENSLLAGPVNACSPHQIRNLDFTIALAAALRRPAIFNVPKCLIKMALGELGQEIMASQKVNPQKIVNSGYKFRFPDLKEALKDVLMT
jgi:uncharacterized protein (TIGR01777 family)